MCFWLCCRLVAFFPPFLFLVFLLSLCQPRCLSETRPRTSKEKSLPQQGVGVEQGVGPCSWLFFTGLTPHWSCYFFPTEGLLAFHHITISTKNSSHKHTSLPSPPKQASKGLALLYPALHLLVALFCRPQGVSPAFHHHPGIFGFSGIRKSTPV